MKKKTMLIEVTSFADDEEILKMISVGKLCRKKDAQLLEWEGQAFDDMRDATFLSIKDSQIIVAYSDPGSPVLVLEKGKKCISFHPSPIPFLPQETAGYSVSYIKNELTLSGGRLVFEYITDYHRNKFRRKVDITVSAYGT